MKMMSSEMDAETDKWQGADENNDIVKRFTKLFLQYLLLQKQIWDNILN